MLEKMAAFFDNRLEGYDAHMLNDIESAREFYPFTAACLPLKSESHILDLGCGTGLELEEYFKLNPSAKITGIDLSPGMLNALRAKFPNRDMELILGSYFDVPFGSDKFDAAVSMESLHHFTREEKLPLYKKLFDSLKPGGYFILTDYFAANDDVEKHLRGELVRLKREQGINDDAFYHYDTPLTVEHETGALLEAGFSNVKVLSQWGNTCALRAQKMKQDKQCMGTREKLARIAREKALLPMCGSLPDRDANIQPIVRLFPKWSMQGAERMWCAAFVYYCCVEAGFQIPYSPDECVSCSLAGCGGWDEFARGDQRIGYYQDGTDFLPEPGDIVIYDRLFGEKEHDHIGIVLSADGYHIETAEGNGTNENISGIMRRKREAHIRAYIRIPDGFIY